MFASVKSFVCIHLLCSESIVSALPCVVCDLYTEVCVDNFDILKDVFSNVFSMIVVVHLLQLWAKCIYLCCVFTFSSSNCMCS